MDSNRKQDLFPFYMPWRHHICIDKCHYSYRDDLPENLPKNHCPRMQKVHFRWPLKRLILTRNVTRYSNEPIKYIIVALLFTFEQVVLTFRIDKQMQEKKYFQQMFLLFKCHFMAGIPFGGISWFLLDREAIRQKITAACSSDIKNITSN